MLPYPRSLAHVWSHLPPCAQFVVVGHAFTSTDSVYGSLTNLPEVNVSVTDDDGSAVGPGSQDCVLTPARVLSWAGGGGLRGVRARCASVALAGMALRDCVESIATHLPLPSQVLVSLPNGRITVWELTPLST
ncbi:MAG: hypothetical protein ACK56I_23960, partial [bacterium]